MKTYSYGTTPTEIIKEQCNTLCPKGYSMIIKSQLEWDLIVNAVNQGIDSYLEAITERSKFDNTTGKCLIHPDELHVFLRRLMDMNTDDSTSLRSDILSTLDIEEI